MSSPSGIPSSSSRPSRDFEDTLIFREHSYLVKNWYNRQSRNGSTNIKMIQLRSEYAAPFHQFIVVQTRGELLSRAYRVDRGRERERFSVFDTFTTHLGIPPRDTIAPLQEPVEELDATSQCTKELHCSSDNIDLLFVLGICFRIHNHWGTRYNLLIHNCYFFARTIVNTCDNRLGKESSRSNFALKRIPGMLIEWLLLLLWILLLALMLALSLAFPSKYIPSIFGAGIVLGAVDVLFMLPAMMQVYVTLAVRVAVAEVVWWERELEQREALETVEWEQDKLLRPLRRRMPDVMVLGMLVLEVVIAVLLLLLHKGNSQLFVGFSVAILAPPTALLCLYPITPFILWLDNPARPDISRLLYARTTTGDTELELELRLGLGAIEDVVTTDQAEEASTIGLATEEDGDGGAVVDGAELEQEQWI